MPKILIICLLCACTISVLAQPFDFDTTTITAVGDTALFHVQIPSNYSPASPPAIIVGWHALGGSQVEIFAHEYADICDQRGWILASHMGPNDRHWNTHLAQQHCRAMLEWLDENYPFSRDSVYMCGASMGAAAGQVWHNNNCAFDDKFFIAATAGGSQILDCQLRQEQYLALGDTNRSMRVAFGGLPSESDSVAYEYHRYSAVHFADTSESMHFNCLTIPVWSNWGAEQFEWDAYGYNAQRYAVLRQDGAESQFAVAGWNGHGFPIMITTDVCNWFAQYSANRFPDSLSLTADEDGRYYFCDVTLRDSAYTFARWDVRKDRESKRLDLVFLQNTATLTVNFVFPWDELDSLYCNWQSIDPVSSTTLVTLTGMPANSQVRYNGEPRYRVGANGELTIELNGSSAFALTFHDSPLSNPPTLPNRVEIAQAFPNPFNSQISLMIATSVEQLTNIAFYDVRGRLVRSFPVRLQAALNTFNLSVRDLASGTYWVKTDSSEPVRVVLIR